MSKYTYNQILNVAKNCQTNVKKNYTTGITNKWAYFFAKAILKPNTDFNKLYFYDAEKPVGDAMNRKIIEKDYLLCCSRLIKYVEANKKMPNYIKWNDLKIHPKLFTETLSRIVIYYSIHKRLPTYATINSNVFNKPTPPKLHSYMTEKGCKGMGQCTGYYCACNSLQQCIYRLTGIFIDESIIASIAGTTTFGTSHQGINTFVVWFNKKYNKKIKLEWKNFSDLGKTDSERWAKLQSCINKGAVFCHLLYRNQYGHYEVPLKVNNSTIDVLNSLGNSCGGSSYCGYIENRSKAEQLRYIGGISQKSIAILTL